MKDAVLTSASDLSLPADSYIYRFAAVDPALAAISSDNSLRVFDAETLQLVSDGIFENVHDGVTCLGTTGLEPKTLFTAGRDGFIRCWDLRIGKKAWEIRGGIKIYYAYFGDVDIDPRVFKPILVHCYHPRIAHNCSRNGASSITSNGTDLVRLLKPSDTLY